MNNINISKCILKKRKEMKKTQQNLADYIGVTTASVSKWETGSVYPDITLLPLLASYFNITIDELMGYVPSLTKEEIRKTYHRLSKDFSAGRVEDALSESRELIKNYYTCYPLLLQMGILFLNHAVCLKEEKKIKELQSESRELFKRVRTESDNIELINQAIFLEALLATAEQDADGVLELLEERKNKIVMPVENILSNAYQLKGDIKEAKQIMEIGLYQNIVVLMNLLCGYIPLITTDASKLDETLKRTFGICDLFKLRTLHPALVISACTLGAVSYMQNNNKEKALEILEEMIQILEGDDFTTELHGDEYFESITPWLEDLDLGVESPRDERVMIRELAEGFMENPIFEPLKEYKRFEMVNNKLKKLMKGND